MLKTLIVDGNSVLQTGFHGVKDFYHNDKHFGAIFYFLNTIKKHLEKYDYDKVVVFWDGKNNHKSRRELYSEYKNNRKKKLDKEKVDDMFRQKNRISQYLEEFFIRQAGFESCEADDCIAYYTQNTKEKSTILTNDKDLLQLINKKTRVYLLRDDGLLTHKDKIKWGKVPLNLPIPNILLIKILLGDRSDNIKGVLYFGEKSILNHFPEIQEKELTLENILHKTKTILDGGSKDRGLRNLNEGICGDGRKGEDFFNINRRLIDLKNVFLTEEAKTEILSLIKEPLDPEGRENINVLEMMKEDGLFTVLPKHNDEWTNFFKPLIKLRKKEITYYNKKQI
tara:strand:+ start:214 stop:1227 length:1014 start_codon:yes stop_codon:yes gene_type:complete